MDVSRESRSESEDIIKCRIENFFRILRNIQEEVQDAEIRGPTENLFKKFISGVVESLEEELRSAITEITEIKDLSIKIHRSGNIHSVFEDFIYEVDAIIRQSKQIPDELYYFIADILSRLRRFQNMYYILISGPDLSTVNFSYGLERLFRLFPSTKAYIVETQKFLWEISVPPFLLTNPLDWPMVIHEIGHMIEDQFLRIVDNYYKEANTFEESDIKYRYAKEFQADYIATCLIGTVFGARGLVNYFTKEIKISPTHPAWKERMDAIEKHLKELGLSFTDYESMLKNLPPENPLIGREKIEHLQEIIERTHQHIEDALYKPSSGAEEKAINRLIRFVPYTDDIRVLLNVAEKAKKGIISSSEESSQSSPEDRERIESEFNYLLRDAIRLSYLKKFFAPVFK